MKHEKKLKAILKECGENSLKGYVINDLLEAESVEGYLKDLMNHGCQSGMVSGLIYYTDTKEFYNDFCDEIEELKEELESDMGEPLKIGRPVYNWLSWFGYEETARKIADELNIEL